LSARKTGTSPWHDLVREPFDERRLADAGLADEHGLLRVRRHKTWTMRCSSSSRPTSGSSEPRAAAFGQVARELGEQRRLLALADVRLLVQ
jgi:hypothetical protein